ncbi:bifunctional 5,10-methylenetetrahydrofolate dehydrogenase/5,10-methenyltetrahydrofolate cyclohydrolase [candidate division WOR-3 bacterium]|nr:bifunctional 5,10-methylenetetrahydrofolate dehydrogenase/5,10-methenyltetrahydrofolate cyclohydrolase [candidate division WOR-3 bacterium]
METRILEGRPVADKIYSEIAKTVAQMDKKPELVVFLIGDDPASRSYVKSKTRAAEKIGIKEKTVFLPENTSENDLERAIRDCVEEENPDGILVQFPLPQHINPEKIISVIPPEKDVDGLHPQNLGALMRGTTGHYCCTPSGIMALADYYGIDFRGKNTVLIGRSLIVGKPLANLLLAKGTDATLTVCHSLTKGLEQYTKKADIVISAVGKANYLKKDMVKEGCVIIDVGVNRIESSSSKSGYQICGDADYKDFLGHAGSITPVPGGVGLLTVAMLMKNTVNSALYFRE